MPPSEPEATLTRPTSWPLEPHAFEPLTEVEAPDAAVTPSVETTAADVTPPIGPRVAPLPAPPSTGEPVRQPDADVVQASAEVEVQPVPTPEVERWPEAEALAADAQPEFEAQPTTEAEAQPPSATAPQNRAETPPTDEPATWREVIARIELEEPLEAAEAARESVAWEFEAMTTPDYAARRPAEPASILEPGTAGSADSAGSNEAPAESPEELDELEGLDELEDLIAGDTGRRSDFPLDAFIVPAGAHHVPAGYESRLAQLVADQLEDLAAQLRRDGLSALGGTHAVDELSRVLAAIVTGYVTRGE